MFLTALTTACYRSLSWATVHNPRIRHLVLEVNFANIDPSAPRSSKCPVYLYFPNEIPFAIIFSLICAIGFTYLIFPDETHSLHVHSPYETAKLENNIVVHSVHWAISGSDVV